MKLFKVKIIILILFLFFGCTNQDVKFDTQPPKAIYDMDSSEYCALMKSNAYQRLNEGVFELVTNYPATIKCDIRKVQLFNKVLKERYGLQVLEIYDSNFYNHCIMPIMDSVIISKYGNGSKERIIKEITNFVDK